jgi:AhpD family alkylhydroperoxidase
VSAVQEVEWGPTLLEKRRDPEIEREFRKEFGIVPAFVPYFAAVPWMARSVIKSNLRRGLFAHIGAELAELIFLAVSQENSCRYCYQSQRSLLRVLGFEEERIRRLEEASAAAESNLPEKRVLDFARRISRSNPAPTTADWEGLLEVGYSEDAIREISYTAAHTGNVNRTSTFAAVPLEASTPDRSLFVRLFRPFLARLLLARDRPGAPEFLGDERKSEPLSYVSFALDGLPSGRVHADLTAEAWSSPVLTERCKALIFAVIARGLGSQLLEQEAVELVAQRGLDRDAIEEALSHLASPELDPIEALAISFARETIRYRPEDIQRRAAELREKLSQEQFLELIGVAGLDNASARLSLVLVERE